jgi:hypothetical protein
VVLLEPKDILRMGDLFHIWGEAGSGKTLLSCALATESIKEGHVSWVCTDGKRSFVRALKSNISALGELQFNITVRVPTDHWEVQETVVSLCGDIHPATSMVVVDPITRTLDMSRRDALMWGRELIEEVLPSLVALTDRGVKVVLVSEVRRLDDRTVPVMHDSIKLWHPTDLRLTRGPGRDSTIHLRTDDSEEPLARMTVEDSGVVRLTGTIIEGRQNTCSESQSSATP